LGFGFRILNKIAMSDFKSYKDLDIYIISMDLFLSLHPKTLKLPKYELYELGSQLRRSSDSIVSNIVEGYGRRRYKAEFIRFLVFSHGSCLETINHIYKITVLYPDLKQEFGSLMPMYENLGGKIFNFIIYVDKNWK
jgi:four helix bundle protein